MLCAGVGLLFTLGAALAALFFAAALLRGAVALTNRMIGSPRTDVVVGWDWDSDDDDEEIVITTGGPAVPEPGLGRGVLIALLAAVANTVTLYAVGVVLYGWLEAYDDWDVQVLVYGTTVALGYAALTALLTKMLPTTVRRAALVSLVVYLLLAALAALVGASVALVLL